MHLIPSLIATLVDIYSFLICVYVLMSWIPMRSTGWLADAEAVLMRFCEPYLNLFRGLVPPLGGIMDITPIIALLVLQFGARLILILL